MDKRSINANPDPWTKKTENTLKIASLNCAGLRPHFEDIKTDEKILKADIIHFVETSLATDEDAGELTLNEYNRALVNIGNGKGIATYYDDDKIKPIEEVKMEKFQIAKFQHSVSVRNSVSVLNIGHDSSSAVTELGNILLSEIVGSGG